MRTRSTLVATVVVTLVLVTAYRLVSGTAPPDDAETGRGTVSQ
jgi:hypothetical protein